MYKVLIADDEGIMIEALTFIIKENFDDQCMIQGARSGREAIERAEHFHPDIIFMDIKMPGINGIEAIEEIKITNPSAIFIILSAYDKFDYARDAMKLGVMCYLNKPIKKEEIVQIMNKAMKRVDQIREKRSKDLKIREKMEIVVPIIENGFVYSMIFEKNFMNNMEEFQKLLDIKENSGFIMVLHFQEKNGENLNENTVGISIRMNAQYGKMREIIKDFFQCAVGAIMGNMVTVYVPFSMLSEEEEYEKRIEIIENARKMCHELARKLDIHFQAAIGSVYEMTNMYESYREAIRSMEYAKGVVVHNRDLPFYKNASSYPILTEKELIHLIESGNLRLAECKAEALISWMKNEYPELSQEARIKVLEIILYAENLIYENNGNTDHFQKRGNYLNQIINTNNYEELRQWFVQRIRDACCWVKEEKEEMTVDLIRTAKEYIQFHFSRDISLDEISEQVQISPYYFSKLFKKETGENFIEYLTKIRIEKAKKLLSESHMTMKEISDAVGYSNPNYFSHTFKKNVGISPSEYKEKKK